MKKLSIRSLVLGGILVAFSVVLSRFTSIRFSIGGVENVRFGLGTLPIMLSGILFGPLMGAVVGILADILGMLVSSMGTFMPQFTFVSMLYGFIPPLLVFPFQYSLFQTKVTYRLRVYLGIILGQLIPQWLFLPYFQLTLFKTPYTVSLPPRLVTVPIQIVACILILPMLLRYVNDYSKGK